MRHVLELESVSTTFGAAIDTPSTAEAGDDRRLVRGSEAECAKELARAAGVAWARRAPAVLRTLWEPIELVARVVVRAPDRAIGRPLLAYGLVLGACFGAVGYVGGSRDLAVFGAEAVRFNLLSSAALFVALCAAWRLLRRRRRARAGACRACGALDVEARLAEDAVEWVCRCGETRKGEITRLSVFGAASGPIRIRTSLSAEAAADALNVLSSLSGPRPARRPLWTGPRAALASTALVGVLAAGLCYGWQVRASAAAARTNVEANRRSREAIGGAPERVPSDLVAEHVAWTAARALAEPPSLRAPSGRDDARALVVADTRAAFERAAHSLDGPLLGALGGEPGVAHLRIRDVEIRRDGDRIEVWLTAARVAATESGRIAYVGSFCVRATLVAVVPSKENPYGVAIDAIDAEPHEGWPGGHDLCRLCAARPR